MEKADGLEDLMRKLGEFSRYQKYQFLLHVVAAVPTSMAMLSLVTIAAVPEHRCAIPGVDSPEHIELWNSTLVTERIPINEYGGLDSCKIYGENGTLEECDSWVYDTKYYKSSRGMEWDFVCSRRWMGAASQAVFMMGVVIGSAVLGPLCDSFGRRSVYLWAATLQLICGVTDAFATNFYAFICIRLIYGIFCISPFKAGYVLMIELVGSNKRTFCGALFQVLFGIGVALLGIWGYLVTDRFYLQLIYSAHILLLLPQWFLLDESPRWLWAKGRILDAVAIVQKGLIINRSDDKINTKLITSHYKELSDPNIERRTTSLIDLFRTPKMARRSIIICGCWLATAVVYFGIAMNTGKLSGNPFLILTISGLVEIPGYVLGMGFINRYGHRAPLSISMLSSGIACFIIVTLPQFSTIGTVAAMMGKLVASASYAIIYKYSAELFPTVVRSSAVGLGTMCASISGALAPLIYLLDTFSPKIPTLVFGLSALLFGLCCLFLPETKGRTLPQTLEDGERFGEGDTCFRNCFNKGSVSGNSDSDEVNEPLNNSKLIL